MIFKYINYLLIITWVVKFNMTGLPFADTWYKFIPTADILKQLSNVTIIQPDKLLTPCPFENLLTNIQDFTEHDLNHMFAEPLDNGNIKAGTTFFFNAISHKSLINVPVTQSLQSSHGLLS